MFQCHRYDTPQVYSEDYKDHEDLEVVSLAMWLHLKLPVKDINSAGTFFNVDSELWQKYKSKASRFTYLENHLSFVDEPKEWFFDRKSGDLYVIPPSGVSINNTNIFIPQGEEIIKIQGTKSYSVNNIQIKNLKFGMTNYVYQDEGYLYGQAGDTECKAAITAEYAYSIEIKNNFCNVLTLFYYLSLIWKIG